MGLYNLDRINKIAKGDTGFTSKLVYAFIQEATKDLEHIEQGIRNEDNNMIYNATHRLKSSLALFNSEKSHQKITLINNLVNKVSIQEIEVIFIEVKPLIENLLKKIKKEVNLK